MNAICLCSVYSIAFPLVIWGSKELSTVPTNTKVFLCGLCIAQNVATHPELFWVVGAKIQTIKDTRRSDKRESGPKPAIFLGFVIVSIRLLHMRDHTRYWDVFRDFSSSWTSWKFCLKLAYFQTFFVWGDNCRLNFSVKDWSSSDLA